MDFICLTPVLASTKSYIRLLPPFNRVLLFQFLCRCVTLDFVAEQAGNFFQTLPRRLWKTKEVECRCGTVRGNKQRIIPAGVSQLQRSSRVFITYLQLTLAIATGVICDSIIVTTDLVATANARPFVRRKNGNNSEGTTQTIALKKNCITRRVEEDECNRTSSSSLVCASARSKLRTQCHTDCYHDTEHQRVCPQCARALPLIGNHKKIKKKHG